MLLAKLLNMTAAESKFMPLTVYTAVIDVKKSILEHSKANESKNKAKKTVLSRTEKSNRCSTKRKRDIPTKRGRRRRGKKKMKEKGKLSRLL